MQENKILICIAILLLLSSLTYAETYLQETSSVSRIVGESPTEMLRQMQRDELDLGHATYYTTDNWDNKKDNILKEQFGTNVEGNMQGWADWISAYSFTDVQDAVNDLNKNELFILESVGNANPLYAESDYDKIYPKDSKNWQLKFEENNPLFIFDSPYAGSYLPKEDTFISRLVRDSTIIAPGSFNSPQFTRSLLCQLADDKTIGEIFRDARNFHYNGGSESSSDNYIGLVLQSYALFGNPRQKIDMEWSEADKEKIRKYCSNFLENLAPDIEFLEQIGNYSKFRKHLVFEIPEYNIIEIGDFLIINASNTFQNLEYAELVLPIAIRTTHFPINTLITNFSLEYVGDYADLIVENLPSYESGFVDRICYYENKSYEIEFDNAYTEDTHDVIARISPVEVINCTEGKFRLYKKFDYYIDYIALSPVLIKNINAPLSEPINEPINVGIELMQITDKSVNGSLAVFDQNNNKLWETETTTDVTDYTASFYAPENEGLQKYSAEFIYNSQTTHYKEFYVYTKIIEPRVDIPITLASNPAISINFYSYYNQNFELKANYYLIHNENIINEGSFTKNINQGVNLETLSFSGLTKSDQSYTLTIELNYLNQKRTITYLLNTNNIPIIYAESQPTYYEGQQVVINYMAIDSDGDELSVGIDDPKFIRGDNSFVWQTSQDDIGDHTFTVTASDGYTASDTIVSFAVLSKTIPILEDIPAINVYEGQAVDITLFATDIDGDTLSYSVSDSRFTQTGYNQFRWQTQAGDAGTYTTSYSVTDGTNIVTKELVITVTELPQAEDIDNDGFNSDVDCDDNNANVNPDAQEICNGIDDNCNDVIDEGVKTIFYLDADEDNYGDSSSTIQACSASSSYVADNTDCDDANSNINPVAEEIQNNVDDNCNGKIDEIDGINILITLLDGSAIQTFSYENTRQHIIYIRLPKYANITSAKLNITGGSS